MEKKKRNEERKKKVKNIKGYENNDFFFKKLKLTLEASTIPSTDVATCLDASNNCSRQAGLLIVGATT